MRGVDLITDKTAQLVTPAYAIETGSFTLAPWQTITAEGIKLNTPPGKELEDPNIYNEKKTVKVLLGVRNEVLPIGTKDTVFFSLT